MNAGWTFWIDRGGTFTDVIGRSPTGELTTLKLPSESPAYADAAVEAMRRLLGAAPDAPFPAGRIEAIKVGTTVATNALLERKGARTLLVTTAGFADALEIGDQARPELFALDIVKPPPLHGAVVEAGERLAADGVVLRPLDEAALGLALAEARRRHPRIPFSHATLPDLAGVEDGAFANVLCETVIMHLGPAEVTPAVERLLAVLVPGGVLYLSWRVTEGADRRDAHGRLYAAFDPQRVLTPLAGADILLDEQLGSVSSGKLIRRIVARKRVGAD